MVLCYFGLVLFSLLCSMRIHLHMHMRIHMHMHMRTNTHMHTT